jgi:hypothetical protein
MLKKVNLDRWLVSLKSRVLVILLIIALCFPSFAAFGAEWADFHDFLIRKIPLRPYWAMAGSEFTRYIAEMDRTRREQAILEQLSQGNLPDFLRKLIPVSLGPILKDGKGITATIFAMPDYLGIGSNRDFIRIPMNLYTASAIAEKFGFILPTTKIVDTLFKQSAFHLRPQPMPPGPRMRSTACYVEHNQKIQEQRLALGCQLGALISGHKKDIVITNRLAHKEERLAIYGWQRLSGIPIQPLCTVHGAGYADYSHGVRLISELALLNGEPTPIYGILKDPDLADMLSDEGIIPKARDFMARYLRPPRQAAAASSFLETPFRSIKH